MIERKKKLCKCGCNRMGYIWAEGMIKECYHKHKPPKQLVRTPIKKNYKKTGELELFLEIWNERPHICEKCNIPIQEMTVSNFDHILPKSRCPELRLEKSNIKILCFDCHFAKHNK